MAAGPGIEITSEPAADPDGVRLDLPGVGTSTGGDLSGWPSFGRFQP